MSSDIRLSGRLKRICEMCGRGNVIADIGCDHGFTSITLVKSGAYKKALAMDVRTGPLERADANIRQAGLSEKIETRLSNGFEKLKSGEADAAVITGMGGELICHILEAYPDAVSSLSKMVLGPQSESYLVRRKLREIGFTIRDEQALYDDGKYYEIILCVKNTTGTNNDFEENDVTDIYGPVLLNKKDESLKERLDKEKAIAESLLKNLDNAEASDSVISRMTELKHQLSVIDKALEYYL